MLDQNNSDRSECLKKNSDRDKIVNEIINIKYYSANDAVNADVPTRKVFIIANERKKTSGKIGRYYTVFPTFRDFLTNRDAFKHSHEVLLNHVNNKPNNSGRLVFDFDIKDVSVPTKFKRQIEKTICGVIWKYFKDVDIEKFSYVWSTSENPNKFSKHLTVKGLHFTNWIELSNIFYKLFLVVWKNTYDWINPSNLLDFQIVKNRTSLRMVGSAKLDGCPLVFDDPTHTLTDSLIRIYFRNKRLAEQTVSMENLNQTAIKYISSFEISKSVPIINPKALNQLQLEQTNPTYSENIYRASFDLFNILQPKIFTMGKINGRYLSLIRQIPFKCFLSQIRHENENAYLIINKTGSEYSITFGCFRKCRSKKIIGRLDISTLKPIENKITDISFSSDSDSDSDTDSDPKSKKISPPSVSRDLYRATFDLFNNLQPNIFKIGKKNGPFINLIRLVPYNCLLSHMRHENEDAFLIIKKNESTYAIIFGCRAKCRSAKLIGNLSLTQLEPMIHPNFVPRPIRKPRSKSKLKMIDI